MIRATNSSNTKIFGSWIPETIEIFLPDSPAMMVAILYHLYFPRTSDLLSPTILKRAESAVITRAIMRRTAAAIRKPVKWMNVVKNGVGRLLPEFRDGLWQLPGAGAPGNGEACVGSLEDVHSLKRPVRKEPDLSHEVEQRATIRRPTPMTRHISDII